MSPAAPTAAARTWRRRGGSPARPERAGARRPSPSWSSPPDGEGASGGRRLSLVDPGLALSPRGSRALAHETDVDLQRVEHVRKADGHVDPVGVLLQPIESL